MRAPRWAAAQMREHAMDKGKMDKGLGGKPGMDKGFADKGGGKVDKGAAAKDTGGKGMGSKDAKGGFGGKKG
jgi:hypothetical protein